MDNYFSLETVADILSKSKFTIESWQKNGKLIPELDPIKYDKPYSLSNYWSLMNLKSWLTLNGI